MGSRRVIILTLAAVIGCVSATINGYQPRQQQSYVVKSWSAWGEYRACSKPCGGGEQKRYRTCESMTHHGYGHNSGSCYGSNVSSRSCNNQCCVVYGGWGVWSNWTCSSNGYGNQQKRSRTCTNPAPKCGGRCHGSSMETRTVTTVHSWSTWGDYGTCSKTCGGGEMKKYRTCESSNPCGAGRSSGTCEGSNVSSSSCNNQCCVVYGGWGVWSSWTCSSNGYGNQQKRSRTCTNPAPKCGGRCHGSSMETRTVTTVHSWSTWGDYGTCSKTCGGGEMKKYRTCESSNPCGAGRSSGTCAGSNVSSSSCNNQCCVVYGGWGDWSSWACSNGYGNQQQRSRSCTNPAPKCGGRCHGSSRETRATTTVHSWSDWGEYETCSKACGGGEQKRYRTCESKSPCGARHNSGTCVGPNNSMRRCNQQCCAVNGGWGDWNSWACSSSGYGSQQKRSRTCSSPAPYCGGAECYGSSMQTRAVTVVHSWSAWGEYGTCSKTCGGGTQRRHRTCESKSPCGAGHHSGSCSGNRYSSRNCNHKCCPVNGNWGYWGDWARTSGYGHQQKRSRTCSHPGPSCGGRDCHGQSMETQSGYGSQ